MNGRGNKHKTKRTNAFKDNVAHFIAMLEKKRDETGDTDGVRQLVMVLGEFRITNKSTENSGNIEVCFVFGNVVKAEKGKGYESISSADVDAQFIGFLSMDREEIDVVDEALRFGFEVGEVDWRSVIFLGDAG